MKASFGALTLSMGLAALAVVPTASAQTSYYYAGQAAGDQPLMVDLGSIVSVGEYDITFDYVLGEELIASQARCVGGGSWTTLSDGMVRRAQSQATREMLRLVCSYSDSSTAVASLPPSVPIAIAVEPASTLPMPPSAVSPPVRSSSMQTAVQTALVYDPSSNVRAVPNGQIICSIDTRAYINIYGRLGDWYDTDACGPLGVIHISQIQF